VSPQTFQRGQSPVTVPLLKFKLESRKVESKFKVRLKTWNVRIRFSRTATRTAA